MNQGKINRKLRSAWYKRDLQGWIDLMIKYKRWSEDMDVTHPVFKDAMELWNKVFVHADSEKDHYIGWDPYCCCDNEPSNARMVRISKGWHCKYCGKTIGRHCYRIPSSTRDDPECRTYPTNWNNDMGMQVPMREVYDGDDEESYFVSLPITWGEDGIVNANRRTYKPSIREQIRRSLFFGVTAGPIISPEMEDIANMLELSARRKPRATAAVIAGMGMSAIQHQAEMFRPVLMSRPVAMDASLLMQKHAEHMVDNIQKEANIVFKPYLEEEEFKRESFWWDSRQGWDKPNTVGEDK